MHLAIQSVSKSFGPVRAVRNVSFGCTKGELVAILGPSGCGKTTLLRIVAGFESADSGSVFLDGESLDRKAPEARRVGMLFQNYALFPHMSVAENIGYGLRFQRRHSKSEIARHVDDLLALVDLPGYGQRRPDQLSAGQQQRVAIARALAPRPRLLLLDEPLSALDVSLRDHLRLNIRRIQRQLNLTTLYVTHDQEEAMSIADRILVMRDGIIEQEGTPEAIYEHPETAFVAHFFGRASLIPVRFFPEDTRFRTGIPNRDDLAVFRAERVHPQGPGTPLPGTLQEVEYLGHETRLLVKGSFGTVWGTAPGTENSHWSALRGQPITLYFDAGSTPTVPKDAKSTAAKDPD